MSASPLLLAACSRESSAPKPLAAGNVLPAFSLAGLDGATHRVVAGDGPMLLNFWATWCPPCRAEMAGLDRLYGELKGAGLLMYGIAVDEDLNLVREYIYRYRIGFPILHDHGGRLSQAVFGINAFPTTLLVRRQGVIADVVLGERDWDGAPARGAVQALL